VVVIAITVSPSIRVGCALVLSAFWENFHIADLCLICRSFSVPFCSRSRS